MVKGLKLIAKSTSLYDSCVKRRKESDRWFSMTVNWSTRCQAKNSWCTSRLSVQRNSEQFYYCYAFFSPDYRITIQCGRGLWNWEAMNIEHYLLAKICLNIILVHVHAFFVRRARTRCLNYARNNVWSYLGSCSREWAVSEFTSASGVLQEWNGVMLRLMLRYTASAQSHASVRQVWRLLCAFTPACPINRR